MDVLCFEWFIDLMVCEVIYFNVFCIYIDWVIWVTTYFFIVSKIQINKKIFFRSKFSNKKKFVEITTRNLKITTML